MTHEITLGGSYPRTEELVKATWNLDKGLLSDKELVETQDKQRRDVIALQRRVGCTGVTDGLLAWQDAFRPLVATGGGFEVGGVTRLFETNRFFRQPIVDAEPKLNWGKLEPFFPHAKFGASKEWKAILPSPYWFARVAKDNHYHDEAKLGWALADYINAVAKKLEAAGYQTIQFNEAHLFHEAKPDVGFCNELLGQAIKGLKATTIANFVNGDAAPHQSFVQTVPTSAIGLDFVETLPEKLPTRLEGKHIVAQVVNAQESHLEAPNEVQELVGRIQKRLKPSRLTATHTWDLEFVPAEVAQRKVEVLASLLPARKVAA